MFSRGEVSAAARRLWRDPLFTIAAAGGLALAIGAGTAVFSVFHSMLLRPMGFSDTARLVAVWQTDPRHEQRHVEVCWADYLDWNARPEIFAEAALASSVNLDFPILVNGEPWQVDGTTVTGNFFRLLGARPALGRLLTPEDDRPMPEPRGVISHRLWRTRFGSDPGVVGRSIPSPGGAFTVVGVAAPEFDFPGDVDIWVPLRASWPTVEKQPRFRVFRAVARLKEGLTPEAAQARLHVAAAQVAATLPAGSSEYGVLIVPLLDEIYGGARPAVHLLLGAVGLVLLIACANAANLTLARASGRARELAVRAALGAGRGRVALPLFVESALLAAIAGAAGIALAAAVIRLIVHFAPEDVPRIAAAALDLPVLAFAVGLSAATALVFGVAPAWLLSRRDPAEALKEAVSRASVSRRHARLRSSLAAAQAALALLLLLASGLLLRTFQAMNAVDPGFRPERVLTFRVTLQKPDQESRRNFYSQVLERVRALPGVESAGAVLIRPLSGIVGWDTVYAAEGQSPDAAQDNPNGNYEAISPDYFRTMGIRLLAGRDFTAADAASAPGVTIVNAATARRHWGVREAIGRRIRLGRDPKAPWLTVVGVAADVRYREWQAARPDFYVPYTQRAQHRSDFVVRTRGNPEALLAAVRAEVRGIDPSQAISNATTMDALVGRALARSRFNGLASALLAAAALLLAAIGIYSVLAYTAAQRTTEIAIRMAVGATRPRIAALIVAFGLRLTAAGLIAGGAAAFLVRRGAESVIWGVQPLDPVTWLIAPSLLLLIAAAAALAPALRAARQDPVRALIG